MKKIIFLMMVSITSLIYCHDDWSDFNEDLLISTGELETIDTIFANFEYSYLFINKYGLNQEEIKYIGSWGKNDFVSTNDKNQNKGDILTIDFLPNRLMCVYALTVEGKVLILFYEWKIEKDEMLVKLLMKCDTTTKEGNVVIDANMKYENPRYIVLGKLEKYPKAFYQKNPFTWLNAIPKDLNSYLYIQRDFLRIRHLYSNGLLNIYQKIDHDSNIRSFLLNRNDTLVYFNTLVDLL